ncbi:MAG: hypothetical protein H3C62_03010 [Gemmatimonadaceae bacterium]|nr:hypothetical protein [Gemmatimonadaceae bacterium]
MTARKGFALAAVLATLILLSMSVAIGAQQALRSVRESELAATAASLDAAALAARIAALESPVDSLCCGTFAPGATLGGGGGAAGAAVHRWNLLGTVAPYAVLEVQVEQPIRGGVARERFRLAIIWQADSAGLGHWSAADVAGWIRLPVP